MTSTAQLEANRSNALLSTGPRTPEGKARCAVNGTKHGLTARLPVSLARWCERKELLKLLGDLLRSLRIPFVVLTGDNNAQERKDAVAEFRRVPGADVLLGSSALEYGVDGLQVSDLLISLGVTWNPAREQQRVGRLRRVGSTYQEIEHHLIVTATQHEDRKRQRIDEKYKVGAQLFGNPEQLWTPST